MAPGTKNSRDSRGIRDFPTTPLSTFYDALTRGDPVENVRAGLIGADIDIDGPFGPKRLVYADYVASGRALRQVEDFVAARVLPFYANSHTEASYCGAYCTRLREEARATIAGIVGAGDDCHVVFTGSGATAGINRIVGLLDVTGRVRAGETVRVLVGPYEHHSNLLPWRESGATVIEIPEADDGGPDLPALEAELEQAPAGGLVIGAFSAASNVTGIVTDDTAVTRLLKRHGALAVWDYAGGGPYLPMTMQTAPNAAKDAIVLSPHKFPGGPGASGIMVVRDSIVRRTAPTVPGGGTVRFVSPWSHVYSDDVCTREEAGTPNVIGDIRAALALMVKDAISEETIAARDEALRRRALATWRNNPAIEILGGADACQALPIFAFRVREGRGGYVHHQLFTRMLSDIHGIQARGGCACAGSYAHRLLGIDRTASDALMDKIERGEELEKPGWVRLNLSYLLSDAEADFIIDSVDDLAARASDFTRFYRADPATARFSAAADIPPSTRPPGRHPTAAASVRPFEAIE